MPLPVGEIFHRAQIACEGAKLAADGLELNGVGDSGLDLTPIADDAWVGEQPVHIFRAIGSHPIHVKAVFQAGFSWQVVNNKWPNFQRTFDGFAINKVAAYDERDLDRLVNDRGIVRNGRKIAATIENASEFQCIVAEHGSFNAFLRAMDDWSYAQRRADLSKRFKGLGPTGVFTFLYGVDEAVPDWEDRNK